MKKIFFLILISLFTHTKFLTGQWTLKTNGLPAQWQLGIAIDASDKNTAALAIKIKSLIIPAQEYLFVTLDCGNNWYPRLIPENSVSHVSILSNEKIYYSSMTGKIYGTSDGGGNWWCGFDNQSLTTYMNYVKMFDALYGVAMGNGAHSSSPPVFLKTASGGVGWYSVNNHNIGSASGDDWRRISFVNKDIGYFFSSVNTIPTLYKTTDGGYTWMPLSPSNYIYVVKFYNENYGLAYSVQSNSPKGIIYKTTNGGNNWKEIEIATTGWGNDIEFVPGRPEIVWFTEGDKLFLSTDSAESWNKQQISFEGSKARDIAFGDEKHGWILCDNGKLFYTDNCGGLITDISDVNKNFPNSYLLNQNYPNPFNPTTIISYQIPSISFVTLKIYDVLGSEIATLVNEYKNSGNYTVEFDALQHSLSSGIYYYQISINTTFGEVNNIFSKSKKMVLIK
ncbi:MAG: T9SS type A sorting domain-containing protein [Melioribacteraceae bacterium]|nr:T9SS type A sorting domain-containing protein [Melioribacteraceae bacterium]